MSIIGVAARMRIAIDIDSTLHHYWDILAAAARRRFGVELPYEDQVTWGITRLRPEQVRVCVEETHGEAAIAAARPYPGAVETVNAWAEAGHFLHITSHRHVRAHDATERWLHDIGLRFDELYCSFDKVSRCAEIGIDVLIDDSPVNLLAALERGIVPATIVHPWNRDVCEEEAEVRCARDWPGLARVLEPVLAGGGDHRHAA
jgi:phosphoglycolate phosphatase-like HAD superfamily hydrolase